MKIIFTTIFLLFIWTQASFTQSSANNEYLNNWAEWRGPLYTGEAPNSNPPVSWSETNNVKWKVELPGSGHSTPVVWGNRVFLTSAVPKSGGQGTYEFLTIAVDRNNGNILWQTKVTEEAISEQTHEDASMASNSPATDGERVYAYFGSRGLYCLDFNGNILWEKDFGHMRKRNDFGEGSSPAIFGNRILIQWDHEGQSALYCLDKNNGQEIWKVDRDEPTSWTTPLIIEYDGKTQVITAASNRIRSYDLSNGQDIWECAGLTENVTPNPVFANGILYAMSGYRGNALLAIRLAGASGDITGTEAVLWTSNANTPYIPSPLLVNSKLYFFRQNSGALTCLDANTGEAIYTAHMLEGTGVVYNSPVAAQDRFYVMGRTGLTYVIRQGAGPEILAQNTLDDSFSASLVIAGDEIFARGSDYLYCIAE